MNQQKEVEALKALVGLLWKRLDEVTVTTEALRELLQQHGVLKSVELETLLAEGRRTQDEAMLSAFKEGLDAYQQDLLKRVLERYRGPGH